MGDRGGGRAGTYVNALAVVGDNVYIGGHFQTIQFGTNTADLSTFVVVHNVVQWNSATDTWGWVGLPAKPGVTTDGYSGFGTDVYALAIVGNSLFIGGKFNQAGGHPAATGGPARWERAAEEWVLIDGSIGGMDGAHVRALAPSGGDLLVAGKFTNTGAAQARYVALFTRRPTSGRVAAACAGTTTSIRRPTLSLPCRRASTWPASSTGPAKRPQWALPAGPACLARPT